MNAKATTTLFLSVLTAAGMASPILAQQADRIPPQADSVPSVVDQAGALLDSLRSSSDSIAAIERRLLDDVDVDVDFSRASALAYAQQHHRALTSLGALLSGPARDSLPADSLARELRGDVVEHLAVIDRAHARLVEQFEALRSGRDSATVEAVGPLEAEIADLRDWGDTLIVHKASTLDAAASAGVEVAAEQEQFDAYLTELADRQVRRLEIAVIERGRLNERIETARETGAPEAEITDLRRRATAGQTRIDAVGASLRVTSELLEGRGFDTEAYREALIRSTGEVTGDVLNPQVLGRLVRGLWDRAWNWMRENALTILARVLIVVGFVILFRLLFRTGWWLARTLRLSKGSRLAADTMQRALRPLATFIGFVVGLSAIGVNATALLAGVGAAGVVVGLALQDSIASLFAGLAILRTRPFDVDDVVEAGGVVGKVRGMDLWNTTIVTFDNRRLLVPNRSIWNKIIENRSAEPTRRVEAIARIGYDEDQERVIDMLMEVLESDERVLEDPPPSVFVSGLGESWVEVKLWPWVKNADWWPMTVDLPRLVRRHLGEKGITIPYPRIEILQGGAKSTDEVERAEKTSTDD